MPATPEEIANLHDSFRLMLIRSVWLGFVRARDYLKIKMSTHLDVKRLSGNSPRGEMLMRIVRLLIGPSMMRTMMKNNQGVFSPPYLNFIILYMHLGH